MEAWEVELGGNRYLAGEEWGDPTKANESRFLIAAAEVVNNPHDAFLRHPGSGWTQEKPGPCTLNANRQQS